MNERRITDHWPLLERRMRCRFGHIWLTITWRAGRECCPFCGAGAHQNRRGVGKL